MRSTSSMMLRGVFSFHPSNLPSCASFQPIPNPFFSFCKTSFGGYFSFSVLSLFPSGIPVHSSSRITASIKNGILLSRGVQLSKSITPFFGFSFCISQKLLSLLAKIIIFLLVVPLSNILSLDIYLPFLLFLGGLLNLAKIIRNPRYYCIVCVSLHGIILFSNFVGTNF